jgi:hypothetical protein
MPPARPLLFLWLAIAINPICVAGADDQPVLNFEQLDLADGRKLKKVVVKSYDAKTDRLLVIAGGKAQSIPLTVVPWPWSERLKHAPVSGEQVSTLSTLPPPAVDPGSGSASVGVSPAATHPRQKTNKPKNAPPRTSAVALTSVAAPDLREHQTAARNRAVRYFDLELRGASSTEQLAKLDLELAAPQAVAGWTGRYRTEGTAYLEFVDLRGLRSRRLISSFEVTTERTPGVDLKVVDFTRKS